MSVLARCVELKTSLLFRFESDRANFIRRKLLKFWIQSYLAGVTRIVVGFRTREGVLQRLLALDTLKLPSLAASYQRECATPASNSNELYHSRKRHRDESSASSSQSHYTDRRRHNQRNDEASMWSGNVCLNFANRLLSFVWLNVSPSLQHTQATLSSAVDHKESAAVTGGDDAMLTASMQQPRVSGKESHIVSERYVRWRLRYSGRAADGIVLDPCSTE